MGIYGLEGLSTYFLSPPDPPRRWEPKGLHVVGLKAGSPEFLRLCIGLRGWGIVVSDSAGFEFCAAMKDCTCSAAFGCNVSKHE